MKALTVHYLIHHKMLGLDTERLFTEGGQTLCLC